MPIDWKVAANDVLKAAFADYLLYYYGDDRFYQKAAAKLMRSRLVQNICYGLLSRRQFDSIEIEDAAADAMCAVVMHLKEKRMYAGLGQFVRYIQGVVRWSAIQFKTAWYARRRLVSLEEAEVASWVPSHAPTPDDMLSACEMPGVAATITNRLVRFPAGTQHGDACRCAVACFLSGMHYSDVRSALRSELSDAGLDYCNVVARVSVLEAQRGAA